MQDRKMRTKKTIAGKSGTGKCRTNNLGTPEGGKCGIGNAGPNLG